MGGRGTAANVNFSALAGWQTYGITFGITLCILEVQS